MSSTPDSSQSKTPAAEPDRAPTYPASYGAPNGSYGGPGGAVGKQGGLAPPQQEGEHPAMPGLSGSANSRYGNLLKGPVKDDGQLKDAGLMVGIKLDLEAEVHLTARVRGDILVGLY